MADVKLSAEEQSQIRIPAEDAFRELLPEMDALSEAELVVPTVDIMSAVSIVLGVLPRLRELRAELGRQLPHFDLGRFDRLESYTKALHHANALFRMATTPKAGIPEQANELTAIRERLLTDAQSLANHGLIDGTQLKDCKTAVGYKALAADIALLLAVFKANWPVIRERTPVTVEVLNDANDRAEELLEAVALKDRAPVTASEAGERRRRAFAIFARAYKDAQRAVAYVRADHDDAEEIAPSIFTKRARRRGDEEAAGAGAEPTATREAETQVKVPLRNGSANITVDPNGLPITPPLVG